MPLSFISRRFIPIGVLALSALTFFSSAPVLAQVSTPTSPANPRVPDSPTAPAPPTPGTVPSPTAPTPAGTPPAPGTAPQPGTVVPGVPGNNGVPGNAGVPGTPGANAPQAPGGVIPSVPAGPVTPSAVAPASPAPTTPSPVLPGRGTYTVNGTANSLSVFSVGVDAQELFTAIADKANLRLVVDDTVSRSITVNLLNRKALQIVDDIVSAYGLSSAEVGNVTMISEGIPRSPSSYLLSDIDSIPTKYVDAANARNLLPVFLQDYVKVNAEQNAVVLSAPTEVLAKFREDIAQFDIPAAQILIELQLIELTDATTDQLGISFNHNNSGRGVGFDNRSGSLVYRAFESLPDLVRFNLQALQEKGKARVRAKPRIATVSGRRASIFVGRQRYVIQPIENSNGRTTNFIDAGVRLGITPYTGGQRQVLIDVDAEVSTLSAPDPITRLPEKSTRTASTVVRVNDGQTIVIGGLRQQETRVVKTKVPLLGSIPILGKALFQSKDVRTAQTELVLFITPRILSDTGHLPEAEEKELIDTFLNGDLSRPLPPSPPIELPAELREGTGNLLGARGSTLPLPPNLTGPSLPPPGALSGAAPVPTPTAPVPAPVPAPLPAPLPAPVPNP